jgi:beta-lactamase regulating signal transducer with metallopeptidase domain
MMTWQIALGALWRASWQGGVVALGILLIRAILGRRLAPQWRSRLWLLVAIRFALPMLPSSGVSVFNLFRISPAQTPNQIRQFSLVFGAGQGLAASPAKLISTIPTPALNWPALAGIVWLAGALLLSARLLVVNIRFARRIRKSSSEPSDSLARILKSLQVKRLPRLMVTPAVSSPALYGLFRPALLIPSRFSERVSEREIRWVFLHELAHLRRRDLLAGWILSVLRIVHWFNPLVWISGSCWRADMEAACDQAVLAGTDARARVDYGLLLLKLTERFSPAACGLTVSMIDAKFELQGRIRALARIDKRSRSSSAMAAILVGVVAMTSLTDAAQSKPSNPATQPVTEVYDVRDLLGPRDYLKNLLATAGLAPSSKLPNHPVAKDVANLVMTYVTPDVWKADARINALDVTGQLVIRATPQTQSDVLDWLESIRADLNAPKYRHAVKIAFQIIELDAAALKNAPQSIEQLISSAKATDSATVEIAPDDLSRINDLVSHTSDASTLSSPHIVVSNHQKAMMFEGSSFDYVGDLIKKPDGYAPKMDTVESGIKIEVEPTVSDDQLSVMLDTQIKQSKFLGFSTAHLHGDPKQTVQVPMEMIHEETAKFSVPDGKSVLIQLPKTRDDSKAGDEAKSIIVVTITPTIER